MHSEFAQFNAKRGADWDQWTGRNIDVADDDVALATTPTLRTRPVDGSCLDMATVPSGDLLMLEPDGSVTVRMRASKQHRRLDLQGSDSIGSPTMIGATRESIYLIEGWNGVVGTFSRRTRRLEQTDSSVAVPVGAVGGEKRLYLLDYGDTGESGAVVAFEAGSEPETVFEGLEEPLDIALSGERIYVLDERSGEPVLLESTTAASEPLTPVDPQPAAHVESELVAGLAPERLLLYGAAEEEQVVSLYDTAREEFVAERAVEQPLTTLTGPTAGLGDENASGWGRTETGGVRMFEQYRQNRKDPETTRYEGYLIGRFDSGEEDLDWHRIAVDLSQTSSATHVKIQYYASNEQTDRVPLAALSGMTERQEQELGRIGIETLWDLLGHTTTELEEALDLSSAEIRAIEEDAREQLQERFENRPDTRGATGPDDLLLEEATGRYLHVMVDLVGSQQSSPRLHAVEAYCPRQTYLRYLPELYQNGSSNDFLPRYLSIFETIFTDIEANIDRSTKYIDAYEIPKDYFPWLNRWFGGEAVLGRAWPETAQRELLERSAELYKLRGTKRGMLELMSLYFDHVEEGDDPWAEAREQASARLEELVDAGYLTEAEATNRLTDYDDRLKLSQEEKVIIREYSDIEQIENDDLRQQYAELFGHPRRFQVLIWPTLSDRHVGVIKTIINADKPVYSDVYVERLRKDFRMNTNTYLGINTYIPEEQFSLDTSALDADATIQ